MSVSVGSNCRSNGSAKRTTQNGTITTTDLVTNGCTGGTTDAAADCRIQC